MNLKKIIISINILVLLIIILFYFFKNNTENKRITIGMMNGWPPFMSINNQGIMEGFDVDIVNKIGVIVDYKIVIKDLGSLSSLFLALEQGSIDAILSGLDITAKRKEAYDFVLYDNKEESKLNHYYIITSNTGPQGEADLGRLLYKVGMESSLSWESTLDQYGFIERIYFSSTADMLLQLKQKKIDCFIIDSIQFNRLKKIIPNLNYFKMNLHPSVSIDGIGIIIKKNNIKMKALLQNAISVLIENNIIEDLKKKWNLITTY